MSAPAYTREVNRYGRTQSVVIRSHNTDGLRSRADRLAATFGRWSSRAKGYTMTPQEADRFERMYAQGWDGGYLSSRAADRVPPRKAAP